MTPAVGWQTGSPILTESEDGIVLPEVSSVRPSSFQELTPGRSTQDDVKNKLGKPDDVAVAGNLRIFSYQVGPFPKVEVAFIGDIVDSIIIHLKSDTPAETVTKELGLGDLRPVPVPDELGEVLGQAFPERGVLYGYGDSSSRDQVRISRILLEPIAAEPFILRALYDFNHQYRHNLADLRYAQQLDPQDARAFWLEAKVLKSIGLGAEAVGKAERAIHLAPMEGEYRLLYAATLAANNEFKQATDMIRATLESSDLSDDVRARCECLLGDLLAAGPDHDYKQAIEHHKAAIKIATGSATDERFAVRRDAKRCLIDAHLGIALDIAWGTWQRKPEVVPKWLKTAGELAKLTVEQDRGDPGLKLLVIRKSLAAKAGMDGQLGVDSDVRSLVSVGKELMAAADDSLYKQQLAWQIGEGLFDAMLTANAQEKHDQALTYANQAIVMFDRATKGRTVTAHQDHLVGRLCFTIGSIYAISKEDHEKAVIWYEHAIPRLKSTVSDHHPERVGQRLVSMGVSYWQINDKTTSLELTEEGALLIQRAVKTGRLSRDFMIVPLGNLAAMYKEMGRDQKAREIAERVSRLQSENDQR